MTESGGSFLIGIDVGNSKLEVGAVTPKGRIVHSVRTSTPVSQGVATAVKTILGSAVQVASYIAGSGGVVRGVGVGFGGVVDRDRETAKLSPNFPSWLDVPLPALLRRELGDVPVAMDNDANAGALGELHFGAGRSRQSFLYLTVGTGVGGAIVEGGRLIRGYTGRAGEIGHMIVWPDGPVCTCGRRGCLEAIASGTSIAKRAAAALGAAGPSGLRTGKITSEVVFNAAALGEPWARDLVHETICYFAVALANCLCLLNPEAVIIGGGVSRVGRALFLPLQKEVDALVPGVATPVPIIPAGLGASVGVVGAAAVVLETFNPDGGGWF